MIHQGDLADQLLNRVQNPEYQGERTKLLYAFPKNEALWAEYKEVRNAGILAGDGGKARRNLTWPGRGLHLQASDVPGG